MTNNILGTAFSGLNAASVWNQVTAENIANLNTDGFQRRRVEMTEAQDGGVQAGLSRDTTPGPQITQPDGTTRTLSNVDLAEELTNLTMAKSMYSANLKVVKSEDELLGTLLDTMA